MAEGCIYIYTGDGRGKSPAAIGRAVQAAVEGKRVVIIQFLTTGECNLLILDEVLGLVEKDIITVDTLKTLLECRGDTDVILTGITLNDEICVLADEVSKIETVKFKVWD